METAKTQAEITVSDLFAKGYTQSSAARRIGYSKGHVHLVLKGERESPEVINRLLALPPRPLILRERLAACK